MNTLPFTYTKNDVIHAQRVADNWQDFTGIEIFRAVYILREEFKKEHAGLTPEEITIMEVLADAKARLNGKE